jgi:hypothetical protein
MVNHTVHIIPLVAEKGHMFDWLSFASQRLLGSNTTSAFDPSRRCYPRAIHFDMAWQQMTASRTTWARQSLKNT